MSETVSDETGESVATGTEDIDIRDRMSPPTPLQKENLSEQQVNTEPKICEFCGLYITEVNQRCPALSFGRCHE